MCLLTYGVLIQFVLRTLCKFSSPWPRMPVEVINPGNDALFPDLSDLPSFPPIHHRGRIDSIKTPQPYTTHDSVTNLRSTNIRERATSDSSPLHRPTTIPNRMHTAGHYTEGSLLQLEHDATRINTFASVTIAGNTILRSSNRWLPLSTWTPTNQSKYRAVTPQTPTNHFPSRNRSRSHLHQTRPQPPPKLPTAPRLWGPMEKSPPSSCDGQKLPAAPGYIGHSRAVQPIETDAAAQRLGGPTTRLGGSTPPNHTPSYYYNPILDTPHPEMQQQSSSTRRRRLNPKRRHKVKQPPISNQPQTATTLNNFQLGQLKMPDLEDSEMTEAGLLLSLLGSKRHLDDKDEETIDFSTNTTANTTTTADSTTMSAENPPTSQERERQWGEGSPSANTSNPYRRSILKTSTVNNLRSPKTPHKDPYQFQHQKLVEISMVLNSDDTATECHRIIAHLFSQFLDVDPDATLLPAEPSQALTPIRMVSQLPSNWTKLGRFVHLKGGAYSLRPRNSNNGDRKQAEPWLVFRLASEMETKALLQAVSVEFERMNGRTIRVKACQSFTSHTPIMFPFMFNKAHLPSLISQLRELLMETRQQMATMQLLEPDDQDRPIPEFTLRSNNPRLPYQASMKDKKFDAYTSQNKRMIHLECCETGSNFLLQLFRHIKDTGAMRRTFGKYVHITEPLTSDACGQDCALLRRMAQLHTNFHNSVQLNSISGVVNLSATAKIGLTTESSNSSELPRKFFRELLYSLQLPDKSPLFLSILPRPGGMVVDCIIPNTAAAETRLVQMNRHLPGYLKFSLKEQGYNHDGIVDMLNRACDPDLTATISQLQWDSENKVVILPSEAELECNLEEMEREPWMQSPAFAPVTFSPSKKAYNDPDHAFPLNSDMSVTTIHASRQPSPTKPAPTNNPSPPTTPTKEVVIIDPTSQDDVSTLSSMSKRDLIKMLLHFNRNNRDLSGTSGFAPTREDSPHDGPQATTTSLRGGAGPKGSPFAAAMGE